MTGFCTRFAPSPTGPLHLGHAFSALCADQKARAAGGSFLLRIEDIDTARARPEWEAQIYEDLGWLGLEWPVPVLRQSAGLARYGAALDRLWAQGLLYVCHCNRKDIAAAATAPQEGGAPLIGPDGIVYPGTCRQPAKGPRPDGAALRLNMVRALKVLNVVQRPLGFYEKLHSPGYHRIDPTHLVENVGDVVLARREIGTSYHLSAVVDDAGQGITDVVRGADLFDATPIHRVLQALLGLPTPVYHHHRLIRDAQGKRLAKRDDARALARYRAEGASAADIRALLGM